jgi:molybdopterin molybdotransferase
MSILSFADARRVVEYHASTLKPIGTESVPLLEARGRVLGQSILADRDFPPFARATRDGYAVCSPDFAHVPASLQVIGEIRAGSPPENLGGPLRAGLAVSIMTGAPLPPGADAVVMVEYTSTSENTVTVERGVSSGENVVARGAEAKAGERLLEQGRLLNEAEIAILASVGNSQVLVTRKPRIAILATGDELVDISAVPGPFRIRNSNSYSLAAQVAAAGGRAIILPCARDNASELRDAIARGLAEDLLLLAGGVSAGKYDLVEAAFQEFEAEFLFTGALIQPGKPVVFGRCCRDFPPTGESMPGNRFFFGLPGNPVSTMVTFELFVRPIIHALAGRTQQPLIFLHATLKSAVRVKPGLTRFLPALLQGEFERAEVSPVPWQGSGDIISASRANCYWVVPPDREHFATGETVSLLFRT